MDAFVPYFGKKSSKVPEIDLRQIPEILIYSKGHEFNRTNENVFNIEITVFPYLYDFDPMKRVHKMTCENFVYLYGDPKKKEIEKEQQNTHKQHSTQKQQNTQKQQSTQKQNTNQDNDSVSLNYPLNAIYFLIGYNEVYKKNIEKIIDNIPVGNNIQCFMIVEDERDLVQLVQGQVYITYENLGEDKSKLSNKCSQIENTHGLVESSSKDPNNKEVESSFENLKELYGINRALESFYYYLGGNIQETILKDKNEISVDDLSSNVAYLITKGGIPKYAASFFSKYANFLYKEFSPQDNSNTMLLNKEGKENNIQYKKLELEEKGNENSLYIFDVCNDIRLQVEQYVIPKQFSKGEFSFRVLPKILIIFILMHYSNRPICSASTYIVETLQAYQNYMNRGNDSSTNDFYYASLKDGFIPCINRFSVAVINVFSNSSQDFMKQSTDNISVVRSMIREHMNGVNQKIVEAEKFIATFNEKSQIILKTKYSYAEYISKNSV